MEVGSLILVLYDRAEVGTIGYMSKRGGLYQGRQQVSEAGLTRSYQHCTVCRIGGTNSNRRIKRS